MHYKMTNPCNECPFLLGSGFEFDSLEAHASGEFPCHKACEVNDESQYVPKQGRESKTPHCAGALIFLEKQERPHQMMRISERLGFYDYRKLNMNARVGSCPEDYEEANAERKAFRRKVAA